MAEEQRPNNQNSSDEIDLGQLFQMIGRGFRRIFKAILRLFLYLKKNALILIGLAVMGVAIGFGLNQIVNKRLKIEIIVKPNLESKDYLYNVVNELQSNIIAEDTAFFKSIDIDVTGIKGFEITIEPVEEKNSRSNMDEDIKYLELLEKFQNNAFVSDVVKSEISNKSSLNHRITVYYKNAQEGNGYAKKIMAYINSNEYFNELVKIHRENALERIEYNEGLIKQVDELIISYSNKMANLQSGSGEGRIILDAERQSDITDFFEIKNNLIRDTERKKLELYQQQNAIKIINFGNMQQVQKSLLGKNIVLIPFILMTLFFLVSIIKFLDRKAKEM